LYEAGLERRFYTALKRETELVARGLSDKKREISTIYIGGGTPSMTNIELFADWLELLRQLFVVPSGIEFSIEHNPETVTREKLEYFKLLGCNRPVFGIQSFNLKLLKVLNRKHDPRSSHRSVYLANALGFENFGVDLIYALPGQTSKMMSSDLDHLLDLEPPHISLYQLTVETGTPLAAKVQAGKLKLIDQELAMAMYRGACEKMAETGYVRYEVSSFAKPGYECKHNLGYWEGADYIGLGPSAHSFIDDQRYYNKPDTVEYLKALEKGERPIMADQSGLEQRMVEAIMLGLRTARGINRRQFASRFGHQLEERFDRRQYDIFVESGHLIPDRGNLRLSEEGILLADEITRRLLK
jgi:oxygen-independent coproporphyrinogen-3 oxidase